MSTKIRGMSAQLNPVLTTSDADSVSNRDILLLKPLAVWHKLSTLASSEAQDRLPT